MPLMVLSKRLRKSSFLLCSLFLLCSCATVEVPNFKAWVELPASKKGYAVETVSHKEYEMPADKWAEKKKKAIHIFSEDWLILKRTIRKNCITNRCKQAVGALDGLFIAIDDALKKVSP